MNRLTGIRSLKSRTTALLSVAIILSVTMMLSASLTALAETITLAPRGVYAEIDTARTNETIELLVHGSPEDRQRAIEFINAEPDKFAPPVFYLLSNVLFVEGERDEGAFWFYAGQLRARVDANIAADTTAGQAVSILNEYYELMINEYTFQDIPKLEALIPQVVEWDRETPRNYDHRWINLHGMDATMYALDPEAFGGNEPVLSHPEEQWDDIAEDTRTRYLNDFLEAMDELKGMTQ